LKTVSLVCAECRTLHQMEAESFEVNMASLSPHPPLLVQAFMADGAMMVWQPPVDGRMPIYRCAACTGPLMKLAQKAGRLMEVAHRQLPGRK